MGKLMTPSFKVCLLVAVLDVSGPALLRRRLPLRRLPLVAVLPLPLVAAVRLSLI